MARPSPKVVKKEESSVEVIKPADPLAEAPEPAEESIEQALPWAEMGAPVPEPAHDEPAEDDGPPVDAPLPDAPRDLIGALCALGAQPTKHVARPVSLVGQVGDDLSLSDVIILLARAGEEQAARELLNDLTKRGAWSASKGLIARLRRVQG